MNGTQTQQKKDLLENWLDKNVAHRLGDVTAKCYIVKGKVVLVVGNFDTGWDVYIPPTQSTKFIKIFAKLDKYIQEEK